MGSYWIEFWPISVLDLVIDPGNLTCHVIVKIINCHCHCCCHCCCHCYCYHRLVVIFTFTIAVATVIIILRAPFITVALAVNVESSKMIG